MSSVTIKWQGRIEEQTVSKRFEYWGGGGFMIYQSIISLLTAIDDNFENPTKQGDYYD